MRSGTGCEKESFIPMIWSSIFRILAPARRGSTGIYAVDENHNNELNVHERQRACDSDRFVLFRSPSPQRTDSLRPSRWTMRDLRAAKILSHEAKYSALVGCSGCARTRFPRPRLRIESGMRTVTANYVARRNSAIYGAEVRDQIGQFLVPLPDVYTTNNCKSPPFTPHCPKCYKWDRG
jgi:hypothetical protein